MSLRAKLDGKDIISVLCADEDWSEAQLASKGNDRRLRMACCDAPAYATHSPLDLRYFAHKSGYPRCSPTGVSDEHECLKAAAAKAVQALAGWTADVEVSGAGWRADVLAVRGAVRIAIEVQLSSQAKRQTGARNDRFEASEVTAFWLKGEKNHYNDFGDGLQAPVTGDTLSKQMESVRISVTDLLHAVGRQVNIANALSRLIKSIPGWTYKIEMQGTLPACFELRHGDARQHVLLGELGPSLLPTIFRPSDRSQIGADQFAGAILQLRVDAPHLRGYQSSSFQLDPANIDKSLARQLRPILEGNKRWQGKEHKESVPGAFVHYVEECDACGAPFLRITHLLIGFPRRPKELQPKVISEDWGWFEPIIDKAERLANRTGQLLGPLTKSISRRAESTASVEQSCPKCRATAPAALFSDEEALRSWPHDATHFRFRLPVPGGGWGSPTTWIDMELGNATTWGALLDNRRAARQQGREEKRQQEILAQEERVKRLDEMRRVNEEQRLQRIAEEEARKIESQRRTEQDRLRADGERLARIESARGKRRNELTVEAEKLIRNEDRLRLWLTTSNPQLRPIGGKAPPTLRPIELAAESKEGLDEALRLLRATRF